VTALWRDPVVNRPENALLGAMFLDLIHENGSYRPDWVVSTAHDPYLRGTGLVAGSQIPGGLLGYEYDGLADNGHTPANLTIIAQSPVINSHNANITNEATTTIYKTSSGALVFDAGTIWWGWGLDNIAFAGTEITNTFGGSAAIEKLTANILNAMIGSQ
jgi:hypothetical protein